MKRVVVQRLTDEELREQLQSQDTILFVGESLRWQEIERQVERLGFGELYIVSSTQGRHSVTPIITVKPAAAAAA
jgi:hypothetical protein